MKLMDGYETGNWEDPFEELIGQLQFRTNDAGDHISAFMAERKHCNGGDFLHGGMLMSFVDYALFIIARDELEEEHAVTLSCSCEFIATAGVGELIEAKGKVVRSTRSGLIFLTGEVFTGDKVLLTFSSIIKKVGKREKDQEIGG